MAREGSAEKAEKKVAPAEGNAESNRKDNAIYQSGKLVAQVVDAEVDLEAKQIRFSELSNSERLLLPDECEFQSYRIIVQQIGYATKEDKQFLHKGRILREVTAKILGHREQ
jgi:hypothetical protein